MLMKRPLKNLPRQARKFAGMKLVRGGDLQMGSERYYPEEAPIRRANVGDFWIDVHPVTNAEFANFIDATGYRTLAEIPPDPRDYPGMLPEFSWAGSAVFVPTTGPVDLDPSNWWHFVRGANWKQPQGEGSSINSKMDHPVVQVAYGDALAYARWMGKDLPTETEWEFAARGGLVGAEFAWGEEFRPDGVEMAKTWVGQFPWKNQAEPGHEFTSPVKSYPPNGFGLYDMIGNVWEWTNDWFSAVTAERSNKCCSPKARFATKQESVDRMAPSSPIGRKVLKGGSFLCAANYCQRYRPAARHPQPIDSPASHIGFRCVVRR